MLISVDYFHYIVLYISRLALVCYAHYRMLIRVNLISLYSSMSLIWKKAPFTHYRMLIRDHYFHNTVLYRAKIYILLLSKKNTTQRMCIISLFIFKRSHFAFLPIPPFLNFPCILISHTFMLMFTPPFCYLRTLFSLFV